MTEQHPISPPQELVRQWAKQRKFLSDEIVFATIAQWGADQELEACCEWISKQEWWSLDFSCPGRHWTWTSAQLRAARRPKPPSLKQQGLDALDKGCFPSDDEIVAIRRALEALPDD